VKIIAHRGDSHEFPENSLAAFRSAVEKAADLVELDSRRTKDGVLVVLHDDTLDRTTNAEQVFGATDIKVAGLKWEDVRKFEVGAWKGSRFKGEKFPTLEESLLTIQKGSVTLLERKAGTALEHAKLLEKLGYTKDLIVQSFDWDFLAAFKTWNPEVRLGALGGNDVTPGVLDDLKRTGIPLAVWHHEKITEETLPLFRERGFELWVYTVDEPKDWERLLNLGIDGMITNKPGELKKWLKARGDG
jgi:glycerophosphoryl diester phosphodiesterase